MMERICIYNRCSTEEENQKNALEIQAQESITVIYAGRKDMKITNQFKSRLRTYFIKR